MDTTPALRILVVDDHRDTVDVFALVLKHRGHHPTTATSYSEALELVKANPFDFLIADMDLPDGDGLQLLVHLRERCPTARGIVLSGFHDPESKKRAEQNGFDDYLIKPATIEQLDAALQKCIAHVLPESKDRLLQT